MTTQTRADQARDEVRKSHPISSSTMQHRWGECMDWGWTVECTALKVLARNYRCRTDRRCFASQLKAAVGTNSCPPSKIVTRAFFDIARKRGCLFS